MNANARMWVDALRYGGYAQGRDSLSQMDVATMEHCCLGVACHVYQMEEGELAVSIYPDGRVGWDYQKNYLPKKVQEWLGLKDGRGTYYEDGKNKNLATLNDTGESFESIATAIEAHANDLFKEA